MDKRIKIRHEETGDEGTCMPSALPVWERNGWTAVEDGSSEEASEPRDYPQVYADSPVVVQPDPNEDKE